jgi:tRNA threonylcarbamoyladenosine biosynthesis protein TsaE
MDTITKSTTETQNLGKKFGLSLKGGEVLALCGDLGSGKTTFLQGLAKGLNISQRIISPTFIIMRNYKNFYHVDLYRLETNIKEELNNLGITDLWEKDKNIFAIEWAQKAKNFLPKNTIWIDFEVVGENERKIKIR